MGREAKYPDRTHILLLYITPLQALNNFASFSNKYHVHGCILSIVLLLVLQLLAPLVFSYCCHGFWSSTLCVRAWCADAAG